MKKIVTFTSGPPPLPTPTHYQHKEFGWIMWKIEGYGWNCLIRTGIVFNDIQNTITPEKHPSKFEPLYGPLTITLNFEDGKE